MHGKPPEARAAQQQQVNEEDSSSTEGRTSVGTDELSTASTQSLTLASESKYQAKLRELENATKKKLESLQLAGRAASRQLESLEDKFHTFATDTIQKIDAVQTELKHVLKRLEDSVNTQGKISSSLSEIQENTAMQFEQIGEHLLTSGENVSILTNSMTDIRAEIARMFGLMAQDIAARNESHAASQFMPTHVPGCIGMINRDHMLSSSSQRSGSTSVPEHFGEIDATIVRSPPPKRTRKGITLSQRDYRGEQEHGMLLDLTDESIDVNDTTFEDVEDNIQDTTEEEFEHDLSTQQSDEVSRNLTARFDDVDRTNSR
ncbi:hypothetical protein MHU86_6156 [Fragilaria crotonensis]|nr:hypothetical protein MHU86_6156 [Fragilaria crotonensis]